jgi:CRISPR-associated protein Cst1
MLRIYTRDWFFNAGIVGFLLIFGEALEDIYNEIKVGPNYIEFDETILDGFKARFNKYLIKYFVTGSLLDELINSLGTEEVKRLEENNWESANFKLLRKIFSEIGINSLDDLKKNRAQAAEKLKNARKERYFDAADETCELITSRYSKFLGSNSVQVWVKDAEGNKIKTSDYSVILNTIEECALKILSPNNENTANCAMCGSSGAEYEYISTVNVMGGIGDALRSWKQRSVFICPKCKLIYACAFVALTKSGNTVYYFANINTSVKKLFEYNAQLRSIEESARDLAGYLKKLIELEGLDAERRKKSSFQFIRAERNDIIGRPGYNLFQYHITPKQIAFLNKFKPPLGFYKFDEKKSVYLGSEWLEKAMLITLSYADLMHLFQAAIRKKTGNVSLSYAVRYVAEFYRYLAGGNMNGKQKIYTNKIVNCGIVTGKKAKQCGRQTEFESLAYSLLNSLKTENINEFLNIYMRFLMSNGLSPEFPVEILANKDKFVQYGYAFLAGLLQEDRPDNAGKEEVANLRRKNNEQTLDTFNPISRA